MESLLVLTVLSLYAAVDGALAPYITPCHAADFACQRTSAQKALPTLAAGIPALGIQAMDPMNIDMINADQAGLKLEFRKTVVKGLRHCNILSLKRQGSKQLLEMKCSAVLVGEYTIGGKLLILKVEGDGKYKIRIRDILVKVQYELSEKQVDKERYWSLESWKFTSDLQGGANFTFQNLFNGNKQLSDTVHEFANNSWKEIFQEVAPPIVKAIVGRIVEEVAKFFGKVPLRELTLD